MLARAFAAAALIAASTAFAIVQEVAIEKQALLLLKILKFDRALETRASGTAIVAIVYQENDPESEAVRVEMQAALDSARRSVTFPLPIKTVRIPYSASGFESDLAQAKPAAAYVAPGLASQIPAISRATRRQGTLTFTGQESYVQAGLAVGILAREARPTLLVNLLASKAEGADLSSDLLRLSEVIR